MTQIEISAVPEVDTIEVRQDAFVKNREAWRDAEQRVNDSELTQEERDAAKSKLIQHAMKNIRAFEEDPRVVDKVIQKEWGPHQH
jgi:hypothetical protein